MVISTAEMKPTCYVSGLQSITLGQPATASTVQRVWAPVKPISAPLPAVVNPASPSHLLLGVGNGQRGSLTDGSPSTPSLQTFDLSTFQSISKQPLARTNPTDANYNPKGFPVTEPTITHLCFSHDGKWLASIDRWQPPPWDIAGFGGGTRSAEEVWSRERQEIRLKFWEVGSDGAPLELVTRINEAHFTTHVEPIFAIATDKSSSRFATIGDDAMVRFWRPKIRQHDGLTTTDQSGRALTNWACTLAIPLGESNRSDDDLLPLDSTRQPNRSGALCFSEDGSTLFVAFGSSDEGVLYAINSASGETRSTIHGLFRGDIRSMQNLSSSLILLSDDLKVYDVVADELRYGIRADHEGLSLAHLAVSSSSGAFAVALCSSGQNRAAKRSGRAASELAIFSPDRSRPLLVEEFPDLIVSLLPAIGSSGFLAVDSTAQVWSLVEATDTTLLAQPLASLNLDVDLEQQAEEAGLVTLEANDGDESDDELEEEAMTEGGDVGEDDYADAVVIAPQLLADIFDAAPAFAMPPIEELFYQITGLISSKLVLTSTSGG